MSSMSTNDEDPLLQATANQRSAGSELLTKIYYPETLYPDNYKFFTDRQSPQERSLLWTDTNDQNPSANSTKSMTVLGQEMIDTEALEEPDKNTSSMLERERGESESGRQRFDVKRFIPSALRAQDKSQPPIVLLDSRFYSMKKTAMTIMCLLIIIMSNSVQLKHVLQKGESHSFYGTQVALGIISVLMCTTIGVILMYVMRIDVNDQYKQRKLDYIDNCVICLIFILAIFNIFIAACS